jgi:hypothetical protein
MHSGELLSCSDLLRISTFGLLPVTPLRRSCSRCTAATSVWCPCTANARVHAQQLRAYQGYAQHSGELLSCSAQLRISTFDLLARNATAALVQSMHSIYERTRALHSTAENFYRAPTYCLSAPLACWPVHMHSFYAIAAVVHSANARVHAQQLRASSVVTMQSSYERTRTLHSSYERIRACTAENFYRAPPNCVPAPLAC